MNDCRNAEMIDAYGFGLPQPIAQYKPARVGDWHVQKRANSFAPGYISRQVVDTWHHVLFCDDQPWMSTALMELESHAWHFDRARGTVVVGGLGMGMFVNAIASKPEVERVIVVDIDADVIATAMASGEFATSPAWGKVEIIHDDILGLPALNKISRSARQVDYLYVDIWQDYPNPLAPEQTKIVSDHLGGPESGWWGQELEFAFLCAQRGLQPTFAVIEGMVAEAGLHMVVNHGYLRMIEDVAAAHDLAFTLSDDLVATREAHI